MKFSKFKKFMDRCSSVLDAVEFMGSGEPFLHPRFLDFVEYASKKGKFVSCGTNGMLVKSAQKIVRSGLDLMYVDIDGITSAQHGKYRIGSNLRLILDNVEKLRQAKIKLKWPFPKIYIFTLINKYNETEYENFIKMAKRIGADGIRFEGIVDNVFHKNNWQPLSKRFKARKKRTTRASCRFAKRLGGILSYNGELQLCCMSPHHKNPVIKINVFEENKLLKVMNSQYFFNAQKKCGRYSFCKICYYSNFTVYNKAVKC